MSRISGYTIFASAVITALASFSLSAQDFNLEDRLKPHVVYFASDSLHGRAAGSQYEKAAASYVWDAFNASGLVMMSSRDGDEFTVDLPSGKMVSRNVAGIVQGYDNVLKDRYIVVGAHLDNIGENTLTVDGREVSQIFYGADDDASGLAMLIELARLVSEQDYMFRRSVVFVAFGASQQMQSGAWYFLNRSFPEADKIDLMINLDMLGRASRKGNGFYVYTGSNAGLDTFVNTVSEELHPVYPQKVNQDFYAGDHRVFMHASIPAVLFTTGAHPEYGTSKDTESLIDYRSMSYETDYIFSFLLGAATAEGDFKASAQQPFEGKVYDPYDCDQRPMFMNNPDLTKFLKEWVYTYIKYPEEAIDKGIQGTVTVSFVVTASGDVTDVTVVKGVDPLLDDEAVKVISVSPRWKPGKIRGKKVATRITIPVEFRLAKGSKGRFGF